VVAVSLSHVESTRRVIATARYWIIAERERYTVTADGMIGRPDIGMMPSGKWQVRGAVRRNNFGAQVEFLPFPQCMMLTRNQWRYANGKPRWHLRDLDHGTLRDWGNPVLDTYPART